MADFTALKTAIQNAIKQNGNEEITGNLLQEVLLAIVTTLGDGSINDLVTALGSEETTRSQADDTLQQNINAEAQARSQADDTLQQNINAEAQARQQADDTLQQNINAEEQARQQGDSTLQGGINTARQAINAINNAIGNGCVYAGIATPSTTPAAGKVFYLALTAGTYTNFNGLEVSQGINILKNNGSTWSLDSFVGIDDAPTPSSQKLVKSGGVFDEVMKNGSAFDLSAYNGGATYSDLNAALTALNALPAAYKRGGMSMKFVQTSDNNYVQYRCTANEFTTDTTKWQGVNNKPIYGSVDLVNGTGIVEFVENLNTNLTDFSQFGKIENTVIDITDNTLKENAQYECYFAKIAKGNNINASIELSGSSRAFAIGVFNSPVLGQTAERVKNVKGKTTSILYTSMEDGYVVISMSKGRTSENVFLNRTYPNNYSDLKSEINDVNFDFLNNYGIDINNGKIVSVNNFKTYFTYARKGDTILIDLSYSTSTPLVFSEFPLTEVITTSSTPITYTVNASNTTHKVYYEVQNDCFLGFGIRPSYITSFIGKYNGSGILNEKIKVLSEEIQEDSDNIKGLCRDSVSVVKDLELFSVLSGYGIDISTGEIVESPNYDILYIPVEYGSKLIFNTAFSSASYVTVGLYSSVNEGGVALCFSSFGSATTHNVLFYADYKGFLCISLRKSVLTGYSLSLNNNYLFDEHSTIDIDDFSIRQGKFINLETGQINDNGGYKLYFIPCRKGDFVELMSTNTNARIMAFGVFSDLSSTTVGTDIVSIPSSTSQSGKYTVKSNGFLVVSMSAQASPVIVCNKDVFQYIGKTTQLSANINTVNNSIDKFWKIGCYGRAIFGKCDSGISTTSMADIKPICYENGQVIIEDGYFFVTCSSRTTYCGALIYKVRVGSYDMELVGRLLYENNGVYYGHYICSSMMYDRNTHQWVITTDFFEGDELMYMGTSVDDPRYGSNIIHVTQINCESPKNGDEDQFIIYDDNPDSPLYQKYLLIHTRDFVGTGYGIIIQSSDTLNGPYTIYGTKHDISYTGVFYQRVGGVPYLITGTRIGSGDIDEYRVLSFPAMENLGTLNLDIPTGGTGGWGSLFALSMQDKTKYILMTFDRSLTSGYDMWTYGTTYIYESQEYNDGREYPIVSFDGTVFASNVSNTYTPMLLHFAKRYGDKRYLKDWISLGGLELLTTINTANSNQYKPATFASYAQLGDRIICYRNNAEGYMTIGSFKPYSAYSIILENIDSQTFFKIANEDDTLYRTLYMTIQNNVLSFKVVDNLSGSVEEYEESFNYTISGKSVNIIIGVNPLDFSILCKSI